ncbi:ATP-binding protein [Macrococcus brunensis]|uniref:ATP-binding protein n=1 Tax=Macrococcus brunensis TaxID=198483 RepID=UPI001EF0C0D6|nr:ATP-binding protein [Macrococcus brunensis]ULG72989.1 ATP-binding protein [Macrococcus brunensis]
MKPLISKDLKKQLNSRLQNVEVSNHHCKKCGRDYELHRFPDGYEFKLGCDCKIIEACIEAEKKREEQKKADKINAIYERSIVNPQLERATFGTYNTKDQESLETALRVCKRYAFNFNMDNPQSLLLKGPFGTGKSHLAISIAKVIKDKGYTALFMNVPQLITVIQDTYNRNNSDSELEIIKLIQQVDLLVLDDVGVHLSRNGMAKLFEIMEGRSGRHNIYTTNLTQQELTQDKDWQRLYSRMKAAFPVEVVGEDHRNWRVQG